MPLTYVYVYVLGPVRFRQSVFVLEIIFCICSLSY